MNKKQIFYNTLSEIDFMNRFFYKKYLLSLKEDIAYQIETERELPLDTFFKKYPIKKLLKNRNSIQIKDNLLVIQNENNPEYITILEYKDKSNPVSTFILPDKAMPLFKNNLYYSNKEGPYVLYFDFYTNEDLNKDEIEKDILKILRETIPYLGTYYLREDINHFYLFIFEGTDKQLINLIEAIHIAFREISSYYIQPCFFITKMPTKNIIDQVMHLLNKNAKQLERKECQLAHYIPYELLMITK